MRLWDRLRRRKRPASIEYAMVRPGGSIHRCVQRDDALFFPCMGASYRLSDVRWAGRADPGPRRRHCRQPFCSTGP